MRGAMQSRAKAIGQEKIMAMIRPIKMPPKPSNCAAVTVMAAFTSVLT